MVEIIEVKDAVGHSKTDVLTRTMGIGKVWVKLKNLDMMEQVADAYGVQFIYKKEKQYFFRANEVTHYYEE